MLHRQNKILKWFNRKGEMYIFKVTMVIKVNLLNFFNTFYSYYSFKKNTKKNFAMHLCILFRSFWVTDVKEISFKT